MTLRIKIEVPADGGPYEAQVNQSNGSPASILVPGEYTWLYVHSGNTIQVTELPAGTKAAAFADRVVASGAGAPLTASQVDRLSTATYDARLPVGPQIDKAIAAVRGEDDFPLGKACDLSGDTPCESCQ